MSMTRRGFLAAAGGLLMSTLVRPAPRRIDLASFCYPFQHQRFELRTPFRQGDWLYATNSKVAVRVDPVGLDTAIDRAKLPPASGLSWWDHDRLRGWKPLRGEVLMAWWECPTCDDWGVIGHIRHCPECDGENPLGCPCDNGVVGDRACPDCDSKVSRATPGLVRIGDLYCSTHEFRKFAAAGECEYVSGADGSPIRIRGDGFDGLLMPVDSQRAEQLVVRT